MIPSPARDVSGATLAHSPCALGPLLAARSGVRPWRADHVAKVYTYKCMCMCMCI